jgi:very-short-patch-repair endonuclease
MTKAESALWKYVLKGRQIRGYQFRRQRPVLNYIADFMCPVLKLIIEVDGITHDNEDIYKNDSIRQKALEDAGFTILRFTDEEVLSEINDVYNVIEQWIDQNVSVKNELDECPPP